MTRCGQHGDGKIRHEGRHAPGVVIMSQLTFTHSVPIRISTTYLHSAYVVHCLELITSGYSACLYEWDTDGPGGSKEWCSAFPAALLSHRCELCDTTTCHSQSNTTTAHLPRHCMTAAFAAVFRPCPHISHPASPMRRTPLYPRPPTSPLCLLPHHGHPPFCDIFGLFQLIPGAVTHAGVLEFTAPEGVVGLPHKVRECLFGHGGTARGAVDVRYKRLEKGTFVRFQPLSRHFHEVGGRG